MYAYFILNARLFYEKEEGCKEGAQEGCEEEGCQEIKEALSTSDFEGRNQKSSSWMIFVLPQSP
ncbi:MAG: hypothetical protein WCJ29_06270 [bacterium]